MPYPYFGCAEGTGGERGEDLQLQNFNSVLANFPYVMHVTTTRSLTKQQKNLLELVKNLELWILKEKKMDDNLMHVPNNDK